MSQTTFYVSAILSYCTPLMASDYRAGKHCPHMMPYNSKMFCCYCHFLFPNSFCSLVNKLVINYFTSVVNLSTFVKLYLIMTFVNIGRGMICMNLVLINFTMSSRWLKYVGMWVMAYSLKSMYWNLYLISVGYRNTSKLSSYSIKLLLWYRIDCWFPPLLFCFSPLVLTWLSPWLVPLSPWFGVILSLPPGVVILIVFKITVCVSGSHVSITTSPLLIFHTYRCVLVIFCFLFTRWLSSYICVHYWYYLFNFWSMNPFVHGA